VWTTQVADIVEGSDPWLSQVIRGDGTWLVRAIAGDGQSGLVPLDPTTGTVIGEPAPPTLPEDIFCGERRLRGDVLCAWDDAIHKIDPATGQMRDKPFARVEQLRLLGVEAVEGGALAVGMRGVVPVAAAFGPAGEPRWQIDIAVEGCYVQNPEYRVSIASVGREARVSLAAYQFNLDMVSGKVLVGACGLAAFAPDGSMAVAQVYGDEPAPPHSYSGPDGSVRTVIDVGSAAQVVGFEQGLKGYFAATDDERLRLFDAASGDLAWTEDWQYGRVQAWDAQNLYLSGRYGLSAVRLDNGRTEWTWAGTPGMAVRTAVLTKSAGLVAATSSGVSGVDPASGNEIWSIEGPDLAGWYWAPAGLGPEAAKAGNTVAFIGTGHDTLTRIDAPPLAP
jgi:hypothetical protein